MPKREWYWVLRAFALLSLLPVGYVGRAAAAERAPPPHPTPLILVGVAAALGPTVKIRLVSLYTSLYRPVLGGVLSYTSYYNISRENHLEAARYSKL